MTVPRRALLVIDVQNEYFTGKLRIEHPPVDTSLPNIVQAIEAARAAGIPVVTVQHDSPESSPVFARHSEGWQLHPAIAAFRADHHLHKSRASAFAGTDLQDWLAAHDVDTLTIVGYMTHNCDAATIYQAANLGLQVEWLTDATGALPYANDAGQASAEEIHRVFATVFHSNFAAVASTGAWTEAVAAGRALAPDNIFLSNQRALFASA